MPPIPTEHMTIRRKKLVEQRWLLAKFTNRCIKKPHNTCKPFEKTLEKNYFKATLLFTLNFMMLFTVLRAPNMRVI